MKVVLRDRLAITPAVQTKLVGDAKIIHAAEDRQGLNLIDIWFEQKKNSSAADPNPTRDFLVVATGEEFPHGWDHITTVIMENGLVWHIYKSNVQLAR